MAHAFLLPSQPTTPPPAPSTLQSPTVPISRNDTERAGRLVNSIRSRFAQTLVGQTNLRESLITTLVAGGHILIESVPGLAKTTAAQTLATSVSGSFKRVQCTPDLMPSDLVGTQVFDFSTQHFTTQIGPIHANFVLLDEINRANAKTQSAMLEAMAEGATTIGGQRIELPKPFMVIATQNPIEEEGTFNLPEAQMDRFMMKAIMTYPSADEEQRMLGLLINRGSDAIDPTKLPAMSFLFKMSTGCVRPRAACMSPMRSCSMRLHSPRPLVAPDRNPFRAFPPWCVSEPPPRLDCIGTHCTGFGIDGRQGLCDSGGCEGLRARSVPSPHPAHVRGARRRRDQRSDCRPDCSGGARSMIGTNHDADRSDPIRRKIEMLGTSLSLPTVRRAMGILEGSMLPHDVVAMTTCWTFVPMRWAMKRGRLIGRSAREMAGR